MQQQQPESLKVGERTREKLRSRLYVLPVEIRAMVERDLAGTLDAAESIVDEMTRHAVIASVGMDVALLVNKFSSGVRDRRSIPIPESLSEAVRAIVTMH